MATSLPTADCDLRDAAAKGVLYNFDGCEFVEIEHSVWQKILERLASPLGGLLHASDCAIHNAPALPLGPCDCGADEASNIVSRLRNDECSDTPSLRHESADMIERLAASQASGGEWRLISTAPKDGETFLAMSKDKAAVSYRVVYFDEDADEPYIWHVEDAAKGFNHHRDFFTHWRPLPAPPGASPSPSVTEEDVRHAICAHVACGNCGAPEKDQCARAARAVLAMVRGERR